MRFKRRKVSREIAQLKEMLEEVANAISRAVSGPIKLEMTHKYERQSKPIRGRIAITMEDGRDYLGTPFQVSKWGGTDWANLPCILKMPSGAEINHVKIEWEYE